MPSTKIPEPRPTPELLTVKQVATEMSVSRTTVYKLIREGDLRVVYVGADMRIARGEIHRFIERRTRRAS